MEKLVKTIRNELRRAKHCAVYQPELSRVWPNNGEKRKGVIAEFARKHGWRLRHYAEGFCAIFDKKPSGKPE